MAIQADWEARWLSRFHSKWDTAGIAPGPTPPSFTPSLNFGDARNSQYLLLFPWLGMTVAGTSVPANAMTLGGDPLTLGGEYLTVGA